MPFRAPNRTGITPQGKGRFAGFDVLDQVETWDDVTAGVVLARLAPVGDLAFFTTAEDAVARPLCDLLLAQDDEPRIPVVALIDARLAAGETDGWSYADMPPDAKAWRLTLAALEADARSRRDASFHSLEQQAQGALVQAIWQTGQDGGEWHDWPAAHVWSLWTRYACAAFYSHPWAWNEMGFGGPAYPRGYKNIGLDSAEPWEMSNGGGTDPVTFNRRIEQARQDHAGLTGASPVPHGVSRGRQGGRP